MLRDKKERGMYERVNDTRVKFFVTFHERLLKKNGEKKGLGHMRIKCRNGFFQIAAYENTEGYQLCQKCHLANILYSNAAPTLEPASIIGDETLMRIDLFAPNIPVQTVCTLLFALRGFLSMLSSFRCT